MADSLEAILSVQDAEKESSWQTKANGGPAENVETDTIRGRLRVNPSEKHGQREYNKEKRSLVPCWSGYGEMQ